jgi:hypothetical protein
MFANLTRLVTLTTLVGGALASGGCVGAEGPVAAGWSAPTTLSTSGTPVSASVSTTGDLAAVWRSPDGFWVAQRPAGASWGAAESVAAHATSAQTAYDGRGRLVLAWTDQRPGLKARVRVRLHTPGTGWGQPDTVARRTATLGIADLAVNAQGATLVGWQRWASTGVTGLVSRGRVGGEWRTGLRTRDVSRLQVALGDGGLAAALVQRTLIGDHGSQVALQVARQPRGRPWSAPTVLQRLTDVGPPWPGIGGIHVDAAGKSTVAWDARTPGGQWRIVAARAVSGEPWQRPAILARRVGWGEFPVRVSGSQRGDVLVTYLPQPGNRTLQAVRWARPGWSEPVSVSGLGTYLNDWDVASDPRGAAVALWTRSDGPGTPGRGVVAALMSRAGVWATPQRLSGAESPDGHARVAAMNGDRAAAVWSQLIGDGFGVRVRSHG